MKFIAVNATTPSVTYDTDMLRQRVIAMARGILMIGLVAWVFRVVLSLATGWNWLSDWSIWWHLVACLVGALGWWLLRGQGYSRRFIDVVEILVVQLSTWAYTAMAFHIPDEVGSQMILIMALTYGYVCRAVFVPSSPRRTAIITGLAVVPLLLLLVVRRAEHPGVPPIMDTLGMHAAWTCMWWGLTTLTSWYIGRITHGLRREVARVRQLGQYTLGDKLGEGGMGEVYRATHARLRRPTAVKLLRPDRTHASSVARFEREAQETALLKSPHTVELYDFGQADDGTIYYVMELLDGIDLKRFVEHFGPALPERVVHWVLQACHSLAEAHARGLVHRDIKPANLMVGRYGLDADFLKVLDFGLVKREAGAGESDKHLTVEGVISGTPAYLAPEQILAEGPVDGRADLYALGCVAYWALTGRDVFHASSATRMVMAHVNQAPEAPSAHAELPIPAALDAVVLACLAKDPGQRPQSASELARRLSGVTFETPWTAERAERWWNTHRSAHDAL